MQLWLHNAIFEEFYGCVKSMSEFLILLPYRNFFPLFTHVVSWFYLLYRWDITSWIELKLMLFYIRNCFILKRRFKVKYSVLSRLSKSFNKLRLFEKVLTENIFIDVFYHYGKDFICVGVNFWKIKRHCIIEGNFKMELFVFRVVWIDRLWFLISS